MIVSLEHGNPSRAHGPRLLKRRWRIVVLTTLSVSLVSAVLVYLTPSTYEATAEVLVDPPMAVQQSSTTAVDISSLIPPTGEFAIKTQVQMLEGQNLLNQLALKVTGTVRDYARHEILVGKSRLIMNVKNPDDTELLDVSATGRDPRLCSDSANDLAEIYLQELSRLSSANLDKSMSLLQARIEQAQSQIASCRVAIKSLKSQYKIDEIDKDLALESASTDALTQRLATTQAEEESARATLQTTRTQYETEPKTINVTGDVQSDTLVQDALTKLNTLLAQRASLTAKLTPQHPDVVALDAQIAGQRRVLSDLEKTAPKRNTEDNPNKRELWQQLQTAASVYNSKVAAAKQTGASLQAAKARLERYPAWQVQFAAQDLKLNAATEDLERFRKAEGELEVQGKILQIHARVIEPAIVPIEPTGPKKWVVIALSAFIGFVLGVMLSLTRSSASEKVLNLKDIEEFTGLRVLGEYSCIKALPARDSLGDSGALDIATWIALQTDLDEKGLLLAITSVDSKGGKSSLISAMAATLASLYREVIIVQLRPDNWQKSGQVPSNGALPDVLRHDIEGGDLTSLFQESIFPGVIVIPFDNTGKFSGTYLGTKEFKEGVARLRKPGRIVLIDAPSAEEKNLLAFVARASDAVIIAVRPGGTRAEDLSALWYALETIGAHPIGTVLVQAPAKGKVSSTTLLARDVSI